MVEVGSWDPWREAEARTDTIVAVTPLASLFGGGFMARRHGRTVIGLAPDLDGPRRTAALAHELVHADRGGLLDALDAPGTWATVVQREERAVDREVARRLAPVPQVRRAVEGLLASDRPVTARSLAAELDLSEQVAALALDELALDRRTQRRPVRTGASRARRRAR